MYGNQHLSTPPTIRLIECVSPFVSMPRCPQED